MAYNQDATDKVYNLVCEKIRSQIWKVDDKIWTEQEFVNNLHVSRVAVRQALDKLVMTGTIRKVQGSGSYVQGNAPLILLSNPAGTLNDSDLIDILRFRVIFEPGNVEMFIHYATNDDFQKLNEIHEKLMACDPESDVFFSYDFAFHDLIASGTHNKFVVMVESLISSSLSEHQHELHGILGPQIAREYHPQIIKYIQLRDSDMASLTMKRHIEYTLARTETYVRQKEQNKK